MPITIYIENENANFWLKMFKSTQLSSEQQGGIAWALPKEVYTPDLQGYQTKGTVLLVHKKQGIDSPAMQTVANWFKEHPTVLVRHVYIEYGKVHPAQIAEKALDQYEKDRDAFQDQLAHLTRTAGGILDDVQTLTQSVNELARRV